MGGDSLPIEFSAGIGQFGEIVFNFAEIEFNQNSFFISISMQDESSYFKEFILTGKSDDGTKFKTEHLYFNSIGHNSNRKLKLSAHCSEAFFFLKFPEPVTHPLIRLHLKGFQNFRQLKARCELGTVTMDGDGSIHNHNIITGYLSLVQKNESVDFSEWRTKAEKLLEHVRKVMSFATASSLQTPVIEYHNRDNLEVVVWSQTEQHQSFLRTFHHLHLQPIFEVAIESFFNPPVEVKNLHFTIEWFSMSATYNEVRLVAAMTALENLVSSNLDDTEIFIRPEKEFDKIRKELRKVIKKCLEKWSLEEKGKISNEIVPELNEKLIDLNRTTIFRKIKFLANQWGVPFDGISDVEIRAAKKARDLIIHRGYYYEEGNNYQDDLWKHVTIIREILVRFILTAIGYEGDYISYFGGAHQAKFFPKR